MSWIFSILLLTSLLSTGLANGQPDNGRKLELVVQTGHPLGVGAITFSPDGELIATGGLNAVKLWEAGSGRELRTLRHFADIASVTFSPGGKTLATVEYGNGRLVLWDVQTGNKKWETQLGSGSVKFSYDGKLLISEYDIWNVNSGRVPEFLGKRVSVDDQLDIGPIAISSDLKTLAIGNEDSGTKLWDLESEKVLLTLPKGFSGQITSIAFQRTARPSPHLAVTSE